MKDYTSGALWLVLVIFVLFLGWNLQQGFRISHIEEESDEYVIKVEKQDGVLDFDCWCGNHIHCEDGEDIFMYTCAKCGTRYTNTNCRMIDEFYKLGGKRMESGEDLIKVEN